MTVRLATSSRLVSQFSWMMLFLVLGSEWVCAAEPPVARDWPQWRGATWDGIADHELPAVKLSESWPAEGPPVLWSREIGQGYSSFIAVGDRVWTQAQNLYDQSVYCLDAATGRTVWSHRYAWPFEGGGLYPGPRSTPTWHDGRLYFAGPDGTIGCLKAHDGTPIWTVSTKERFRGRGTDFGYSASPTVIDGLVILPVGGDGTSVVALRAKDGSVAWTSGDSPASYSSALPIQLNGKKRVVALLENSLAIFNRDDGRLVYEDVFSTDYDEHSAAPLYREPLLMIACPFRAGAKCYRLTEEPVPPDATPSKDRPATTKETTLKVTTEWENPKFSNDVASSVLVGDHVYGFDLREVQSRVNRPSRGEFRCLEFATGKTVWSTDQVGHATVTVADGKLILFNDKGEVILARVNPERYEELARVQVFQDEVTWTPPALAQGRLFLRTHSRAVCLYLGKEPLKAAQPTQTVDSIPRGHRFDPAILIGAEREFPATVPEWQELQAWWTWSLLAITLSTYSTMFMMIMGVIVMGVRKWEPVSVRKGLLLFRGLFWTLIMLAGCFGSLWLNRRDKGYVFLWPLSVWAMLQLTLISSVWAERQPELRHRRRWASRLVGLAFLASCALYFHLCRLLGLAIEWSFLAGLLPAFPFAILAAYGFHSHWPITSLGLAQETAIPYMVPVKAYGKTAAGILMLDWIWAQISFSVYYWSCVLFIKWWLAVGS